MTFLSDQKIEGQIGPIPHSFFPEVTDQNFEIAILFSTVEKSNNYIFEDDLTLQRPGGRAAICELCPLFTSSIGCWEVHWHFQGEFFSGRGEEGLGEAVTRKDLSVDEFITVEENFHEGGAWFFSIILKKNNEKLNKDQVFSVESKEQY